MTSTLWLLLGVAVGGMVAYKIGLRRGLRRGFENGWSAPNVRRIRGNSCEYSHGAVFIAAPSDRHAVEILIGAGPVGTRLSENPHD